MEGASSLLMKYVHVREGTSVKFEVAYLIRTYIITLFEVMGKTMAAVPFQWRHCYRVFF